MVAAASTEEALRGSGSESSHSSSAGTIEEDGENGSPRKKRQNKCPAPTCGNLDMVYGVNVAIEEVKDMADRLIVRKIHGRHPTLEEMKGWVQTNWEELLSSAVEVGELSKGWYTFTRSSKHDTMQILNRNWFYGMIPILLKIWMPLFNADSE